MGSNFSDTANSYFSIGIIHFNKKEFDKSIENFEKALHIRTQKHGEFSSDVAEIYNNIGIVCNEQDKTEKALEYFNKSLQCDDKNNFAVYKNLGDLNLKKKENQAAIKNYNLAIDILKKLDDKHPSLIPTYMSIGQIFSEIGKTTGDTKSFYDALSSYDNAKNVVIDLHGENHSKLGDVYKYMALNYENLGVYSDAIYYLEESIKIRAVALGDKDPQVQEDKNRLSEMKKNKKKNNCNTCQCVIF